MSATASIQPVILHAPQIATAPSETFPDPSIGGNVSWKTLISSSTTPSDTFTVGIATCPSGSKASCPSTTPQRPGHLKLHRHTHAEIYHVTAGIGVVAIDGVDHEVKKGSVVFIPGDAEHGIRNVGDEELCWLYVFAARGFGEVVYRFSGDGGGGGVIARL
ncbi:RmlC-like cupin [Cucurbitaria berberidis CBS 394.84]|uniref:RmlC-like cupin n=1 Tax=Cucurbitaria berberidis CBS 394.84 TaxID=1168544 RepID=A0A9P4GDR3_9PLEO|nr:RmlC-like cupin [Cucurbitaria berberidis CBS 394.84]KAF1843646.1 RmlC-like cupin [Cucurbitaria berberidis CBS 394.84]